ncbi:hypothetical protein SAMN05216481_11747 [Streptomyces radiopugnans]|uniref:Uncharacterized protein n=1 Tax=Streptomyces radiopugnans TaxID=403935 RepID=A0A1H9JDQ5_9ACTN|nr:hypothetical protein SAMN05216481_11747 [Streptomyces radiopugnans]
MSSLLYPTPPRPRLDAGAWVSVMAGMLPGMDAQKFGPGRIRPADHAGILSGPVCQEPAGEWVRAVMPHWKAAEGFPVRLAVPAPAEEGTGCWAGLGPSRARRSCCASVRRFQPRCCRSSHVPRSSPLTVTSGWISSRTSGPSSATRSRSTAQFLCQFSGQGQSQLESITRSAGSSPVRRRSHRRAPLQHAPHRPGRPAGAGRTRGRGPGPSTTAASSRAEASPPASARRPGPHHRGSGADAPGRTRQGATGHGRLRTDSTAPRAAGTHTWASVVARDCQTWAARSRFLEPAAW